MRLGINIDHVATIRNARGKFHPDPVKAGELAEKFGADGITIHLREDRRHILDSDLVALKKKIKLPINLEIAATKEMFEIAIKMRPNAICIVSEKRQEITTEGGLDVIKHKKILQSLIKNLHKKIKVKVSLFVDPDKNQIACAKAVGADAVEIHTGKFCDAKNKSVEFEKIKECAKLAKSLNLECHAGHGLNYETAKKIATISEISELNIGHFIISEAIFYGLEAVIKKMKLAIK
jgi:pyridoxine 5-phosphate synthase